MACAIVGVIATVVMVIAVVGGAPGWRVSAGSDGGGGSREGGGR